MTAATISIKYKLKAFLRGGLLYLGLGLLLGACKDQKAERPPAQHEKPFYRAADLSALPKIQATNLSFYDADSAEGDFLDILQAQGLNLVRLRLWVKPENQHHSLAQVDSFSQALKARGLKVWLCLHLSDTWADPGHQQRPQEWLGLNRDELHDSLYRYVERVNQRIKPEILQIGNEINPGFLLPLGDRHSRPQDFISLLDTAIRAARSSYPAAQIMMHYAGIDEGAQNFFQQIKNLDFDIIGLSYYPIWHGKSLVALKNRFLALSRDFEQDIMLAETAYPFSLGWNDWTNNIIGSEDQIIPSYPASAEGQKRYLAEIRDIIENTKRGRGFGYWGGELVAWKGPQGENASPFENQALFNFNQVALPVQEVFNP